MAAYCRVVNGKRQAYKDNPSATICSCTCRASQHRAANFGITSLRRTPQSRPGLGGLTKKYERSSVIAGGILDAYRKDKGLLERQREAFRQSNEARHSEETKDEDDEVCPAECVREIDTVVELDKELQQGGESTLVVVDFYKTACGSCRYIQPGFVKLCQASEAGHAAVVFLKHNIFDEYEELSELSQKYNIRAVPMFMFWKGGEVVEQFPTRDRIKVAKAINKHAGYEVLEPK